MNGGVEMGDVSSWCVYTNIPNVYQQNSSKSFMNYNDRVDMEINDNLSNGHVSSGFA